MTDALAPASQEHAPLVKHETDVGAFFFIENEDNEMRCVFCSEEMRYVLATNGDPCFFCDNCNKAWSSGMNNCQVCGTFDILEDGMCWWCIADANDPDPYVDDSLNEVSMGRFDDDPPEG